MIPLNPALATAFGSAGVGGILSDYMQREIRRDTPFKHSLGGTQQEPSPDAIALVDELERRAGKEVGVELEVTPDKANNARILNKATGEPTGDYRVRYNPNADKAIFAHELGHIASDQTKFGHAVRSMSNTLRGNPKLKRALQGAMFLAPTAVAAGMEGTEDTDEALAIALLTQAPTLVDEALATNNALAMMKNTGMTATPAQRGRLAGAYLTYAAAPLVAGLSGSYLGNVLGQDY